MNRPYRTVEQHRATAQMTAIRKAQGLLVAFVLECVLFAVLILRELLT